MLLSVALGATFCHAQLIALLREHKTGEATKRYKETSGQDYRTAIFVIDQLVSEARR